jgi:Skp family chaperone for outer membrane proteins
MSTLSGPRLPSSDGHHHDRGLSTHDPAADKGHLRAEGEEAFDEEALRRELERLAADHRELLSSAGLEPAGAEAAALADDVHAENARLRRRIEELEQQLAVVLQEREQAWAEQQREYEALLEEKSEVIRALHVKIQELKESAGAAGAAPPAEGDERLLTLKEELEKRQAQLERQRAQLEEDEAALEEQMKQMELAMSRERVELARQRTELQRLQSDFQHELEVAARDEKLRERLLPLQRRHQDLVNSKGAMVAPPPRPPSTGQLPRPATQPSLTPPGPTTPTPLPKKSNSGLLRRLFGGGKE